LDSLRVVNESAVFHGYVRRPDFNCAGKVVEAAENAVLYRDVSTLRSIVWRENPGEIGAGKRIRFGDAVAVAVKSNVACGSVVVIAEVDAGRNILVLREIMRVAWFVGNPLCLQIVR